MKFINNVNSCIGLHFSLFGYSLFRWLDLLSYRFPYCSVCFHFLFPAQRHPQRLVVPGAAVYGPSSGGDWVSMKEALDATMISLSQLLLMNTYLDDTLSKSKMLKITGEEIAMHKANNIAVTQMPPLLQMRMKNIS